MDSGHAIGNSSACDDGRASRHTKFKKPIRSNVMIKVLAKLKGYYRLDRLPMALKSTTSKGEQNAASILQLQKRMAKYEFPQVVIDLT